MSTKNSISRAALIKIASLVRPALATQDYIPALTHIKFDGEYATAYNDIAGIVVKADIDLKRCVPGDLLIRALGSFGSEAVALLYDDKNSSLLLSSGRSKLKLPTLPPKDFPFDVPDDVATEIELSPSIIKGIERCLLSVGSDPTHPAQMGVTLEIDEAGKAVLFSTDNFTISRYQTESAVELPGDSPVILPTFFCEQLVTLHKAFPEEKKIVLVLLPGALLVEFGKSAYLFTKTIIDLEPMDFHKIVRKHCNPAKIVKELSLIPDSFDSAFNRALLVLGNDLDKVTSVDADQDGMEIRSTSSVGDAEDEIPFKNDSALKFLIDPTLVVRATKSCAKMAMLPKVLVLADEAGSFLHLIAHCSS